MNSRHEQLKALLLNQYPNIQANDSTSTESVNPKDVMGATKPPLSLLTPSFLEGTSWAMHYGAFKAKRKDGNFGYGPYNWRDTKVNLSTYTDAILRHASALANGEDLDKDSGLPHEDHIAANVNIIKDAAKYNTLEDDRLDKRKK